MRPYFNAGFICVQDPATLVDVWVDTARQINSEQAITNKRPWLDQIALPIAVQRIGWSFNTLSDSFNFAAHLIEIGDMNPYFVHYHRPSVIQNDKKLRWRIDDLA